MMRKTFSIFLAACLVLAPDLFASSGSQVRPFPYDQGINLVKNVLYINARELSAGAGLNTLWSDTFKDATQINAGASVTYTARGAADYDVIVDTTTPNRFTGGTGSASTTNGGNVAANAFDGNNDVIWQATTNSGWLKYDLGAGNAKALVQYKLLPHSALLNGAPKDWTFEGSNDNVAWTVLDTQTNQTWGVDGYKTYSFSNSTTYRYYRLNFSTTGGAAQANVDDFQAFQAAATQATVRSVTTTLAESVSQVMVFADFTLGTGSVSQVRVTVNGGTNWVDVTNNLEQVVTLGHSGSSLIVEVTFTGNTELEFWGAAA